MKFRAEEVTEAAALIEDDQRRIKFGHPFADDVMRARGVLFHVVVDEMVIGSF